MQRRWKVKERAVQRRWKVEEGRCNGHRKAVQGSTKGQCCRPLSAAPVPSRQCCSMHSSAPQPAATLCRGSAAVFTVSEALNGCENTQGKAGWIGDEWSPIRHFRHCLAVVDTRCDATCSPTHHQAVQTHTHTHTKDRRLNKPATSVWGAVRHRQRAR